MAVPYGFFRYFGSRNPDDHIYRLCGDILRSTLHKGGMAAVQIQHPGLITQDDPVCLGALIRAGGGAGGPGLYG
mgnify:CR=1 FL=1